MLGLYLHIPFCRSRCPYCAFVSGRYTPEAAERYVLAIPRHCLRLRLAALWPLLIGLATLTRLANSRDWLDAKTHIKVKRGWVYRMIFKSCFVVCSNRLTSHWLDRLKQS